MKPYVSYRAPQIKEGPMTADRLYQEIKNNIEIIEHREVPWLNQNFVRYNAID